MSTPAAARTATRTVTVPGAVLTYDVRGELAPGVTPLVLAGSPMDASGFGSLAAHLPDRVLVTYDPRNTGRSVREDRTGGVTVTEHAEDLHAVLVDLGVGPVDLFASSGGAVNALALVAAYPGDVRTLVAHEPPAASVLPDAAAISTVCDDIVATYDARGLGPAMAKFLSFVLLRGPVPADYLKRPDPDPVRFGMPAEDDGDRGDPMIANMRGRGVQHAMPEVDALLAAPTRLVLAAGEESGGPTDGEMPARAAYAVAAALGREVVVFPSGHAGFLGGEFGQSGKPEEFAAVLRAVLARG